MRTTPLKELVPVVVGRVYELDKCIAQRLVIPSSQTIILGFVRATNPVVDGWSGGRTGYKPGGRRLVWGSYGLQTRWSTIGLGVVRATNPVVKVKTLT